MVNIYRLGIDALSVSSQPNRLLLTILTPLTGRALNCHQTATIEGNQGMPFPSRGQT